MNPVFVRIHNGRATLNGQAIAITGSADPAAMYHALGCSYPKFFKMDALCKWAWLGAEALLRREGGGWRYEGAEKQNIAVVLATADGCLDVDKRYNESRATIPSPALFVYTLPNIMLGEICIRHGFTGEQLCESRDDFDSDEMHFWVRDLLTGRGATHCLFGWVNAAGGQHDVCLFWADRRSIENTTSAMLDAAYQSAFNGRLYPASSHTNPVTQ